MKDVEDTRLLAVEAVIGVAQPDIEFSDGVFGVDLDMMRSCLQSP